jgi:hypothetical protein
LDYGIICFSAPDIIFKTLADPTRRVIFERLARDGEQTVRVLIDQSGVSQRVSGFRKSAAAGLFRFIRPSWRMPHLPCCLRA